MKVKGETLKEQIERIKPQICACTPSLEEFLEKMSDAKGQVYITYEQLIWIFRLLLLEKWFSQAK